MKKQTEIQKTVDIIRYNPYLLGHSVGFDKLTELNNEWIVDMVFGKGDETLQAHRNSYKTTCVSIALSLIIIAFPNDKTMFMRKTENDVKEVIEQVYKILDHRITRYLVHTLYNVDLQFDKSSATEITTNLTNDPRGTAQLVGMGINGSITGKHFERIFTDDIVNLQDRLSRAEREHTKQIYQELQNIVNRGGRIYNTGTPWHKDDCFELMPNPKRYDCYSTGLMSEEERESKRAKMLPSLFAANYELKHIASEDVIFKDPRTGADVMLVIGGYMHVDCAYDGEDYTAMTICRKEHGKYYIYGKMWRKHCKDCADEIESDYKKYQCRSMYNEKNADKGFFAASMRSRGMHVVTYNEIQNKFMKIVTYLLDEWENVYFVEGTDEEYISQVTDYNEEAEHDDAPDSLACAIRIKWAKKTEYSPDWFKGLGEYQ